MNYTETALELVKTERGKQVAEALLELLRVRAFADGNNRALLTNLFMHADGGRPGAVCDALELALRPVTWRDEPWPGMTTNLRGGTH